jgi:hypothetical protein
MDAEPADAPTPVSRRRTWKIAAAALAALLVAGVVTVWVLGERSVPVNMGGGWWSADMESVDSSGLTQTHRVFRCVPGELEARLDLVGVGPLPVTITDVRVPMLDDPFGTGRAARTGTQMVRDPHGEDLYDLVDFTPTRVGGSDWLRLVLTWQVDECIASAGYNIEERLEVTYVALGMTHTALVPLGMPFALTALPLDQVP